MLLSEAQVGYEGLITQLDGHQLVVSRLRELGFLPGMSLRVTGIAPFGAPMIVSIRGTTVALRKQEAACIWCQPI